MSPLMINKAALPRANRDFAPVSFEQHKTRSRHSIKRLLLGLFGRQNLLANVTALFLGRSVLLGQLSPFALAFFVAVRALAPSRSLYVAIWTAVGIFWGRGAAPTFAYLVSLTLALVFEKLLNARGSRRLWRWPVIALLSAFAVDVPWFVIEMPSIYESSSVLLENGLIPILTIIFLSSARFVLHPRGDRTIASEEVICLCILLAAAITGLNGLSIGMYSLKGIVLKYVLLLAAFVGGSPFAATMGITLALIANISDGIMLPQIGLYSFAGLLAGLFREYRKPGVVLGFALGYSTLALYYLGRTTLATGLVEIGVAGVAFMVSACRLRSSLDELIPSSVIITGKRTEYIRRLQDAAGERLADFASIFERLADTFAIDDEERQWQEENLSALMEELCDRVCTNCQRFRRCWEQELYQTYNALFNAVALAEHQGGLTASEMPQSLQDKCLHIGEFAAQLNTLTEKYKLNYYWQQRMSECRQLVATQLAGVARIVKDLASELRFDVSYETDLEDRITRELDALSIDVRNLHVTCHEGGKMSIKIVKKACENETQCTSTIIPVVAGVIGKQVSRGGARCAALCGKQECTLCLTTAQNYEVACGIAYSAAGSHQISGDTHSLLELPNGKFAAILSDGMGSGHDAKQQSEVTVSILESLLQTGFSKSAAVKTINSVLSLRSPDETFATMDLSLIDLYSGRAEFVKIGSCSTFCRRGSSVEAFKSSSLPIGILQDVTADEYTMQLAPGDIIIMVSDGVLDSQRDVSDREEWLARVLRQAVSNNPQEIAEYVLQRATNNCGGKIPDDMTVLVMRLDKCQESVA